MWDGSLALLSGLKIWRGHELWCRSQVQLVSVPHCCGSGVGWERPIRHGCGPNKQKKKKNLLLLWLAFNLWPGNFHML